MPVNITNRADAEAIIREQVVQTIFQDAPKQSVFMALAKKLPNMTSNQTRMRVLDFLPTSYWVDGDTGMKQTSKQAWDNVYINAAELAVIVPIPEAVLDDAEFDIFGEITPRINEAIGQRVDSGVISKVEEDGYMATGALAAMSMRAKLRDIRTNDGNLIFKSDMQGSTNYALDGAPMYFPQNGAYDNTIAQLIVGDFKQAVYSIRQDVTVKILDQGVIQDPVTKEIVYNLAQQDMVALRIVFRMGWALPNPATRMDEDRVGCPFAYLEPTSPATTQKVTFTVKDNSEAAAAIEGAIVDVNGSRKKTDASGVAEFNLRAGTYPAKIKKSGYGTINDTVAITFSAVSKDITLIPNAL